MNNTAQHPPFNFEKIKTQKTEAPRFVKNMGSRMRGVVFFKKEVIMSEEIFEDIPEVSIFSEKEKTQMKQKEEKRLKKIFKDYRPEVNELVKPLIDRCAFLFTELKEAEAQIQKFGSVEVYKNGANQWGRKKSASVEVHNIMIKNYAVVIKQLIDLLPKESSDKAMDEFKDFLTSGKK